MGVMVKNKVARFLWTTVYIAHHYTFIDKLLPGSFQTMAKISRVGHAHPDFFPFWQGASLPCSPRVGAAVLSVLSGGVVVEDLSRTRFLVTRTQCRVTWQ